MASSFVGIMAAVPLAFALASPMNASAETTGVTMADLEKFAYVLGQGQQASLANVTTGAATVCTEDAVVKAGATTGAGGDKAGAAVVLGAFNGGGAGGVLGVGAGGVLGNGGGFGGGGAGGVLGATNANGNGKLASNTGSYYYYSNTVHNSSAVSSVNSNNHVGSHNATTTEIEIEDSKNIKLGVDNKPVAVQKNANESFNTDSYNTKTETKTDIKNTNNSNNQTTTSTDMTAINKTETTNVDVDVDKNVHSNNPVTTNTNTGSFNETEVEVDAEVNLLSKNEVTIEDNELEFDD